MFEFRSRSSKQDVHLPCPGGSTSEVLNGPGYLISKTSTSEVLNPGISSYISRLRKSLPGQEATIQDFRSLPMYCKNSTIKTSEVDPLHKYKLRKFLQRYKS